MIKVVCDICGDGDAKCRYLKIEIEKPHRLLWFSLSDWFNMEIHLCNSCWNVLYALVKPTVNKKLEEKCMPTMKTSEVE